MFEVITFDLLREVDFSIVPALIAGGAALGGSILSGIFGKKSNDTNLKIARENNKAQMDLAQYQADRNLELWNMNNEYNTPSAQMDRYQEAGLNPHLIYGNGSASSGNSSSPAEGYKAPTLQRAEVQNYMPQAAQIFMNGVQQAVNIQKTQAETDAVRQNITNLKSDNELKILNQAYFQYRNAKTKEEAEAWHDMISAQLYKEQGLSFLPWQDVQGKILDNKLKEAVLPLETQYREAQLSNAVETNNNLKFLNSLQPERRAHLISQIANLSVTSHGKELENEITQRLISTGINLRGSALERVAAELLSVLGQTFGNGDNWFSKFLGRFVK